MSLEEAAASEGLPVAEFAIKTIIEEHPYALMVYHVDMTQDEVDIRTRNTIQHPRMMVASDGMYHGDFGHPRGYGCFARVLRYAVRELGSSLSRRSGLEDEWFSGGAVQGAGTRPDHGWLCCRSGDF